MRVCLAGDGWGAVAAYRSLCCELDSIYLATNDKDLIDSKRDSDSIVDLDCVEEYDYVILAGYTDIVDVPKKSFGRVLNIHYSLLPKYRGLHSTVWAVLNGEPYLGLSIHLVNEKIDDGPIVHQYVLNNDGQTSHEFMVAFNSYIEGNLGSIFMGYACGNLSPKNQDFSQATWCCKRNLDDCIIDLNESVDYLVRFFKALVRPYPLPMLLLKGQKFEVSDFSLIKMPYYMSNGRVINSDENGVWIKVNDGFLVVNELISEVGVKVNPRNILKLGMRLI